MNNETTASLTNTENALLSTLNWPNGIIALTLGLFFMVGVTYGITTGRHGDVYDVVIDMAPFLLLALYFNTLRIFKSIIRKTNTSRQKK